MKEIYTIGYSGFKIEDFINTLKKYNINSVIDVRSNPHSQFYVDYNKENLENTLKTNKIIYRNYKDEFGARQEDKSFYTNGCLNFKAFSQSKIFQSGLKKIINAMPLGYTFVLMCSEKEPIRCHRNIMVARVFFEQGYEVKNILSDGTYVTQDEIEKELVNIYYPNREQLSLLSEPLTWNEMVENCYKLQNHKIGYRINDNERED